jgi:hypothetical protein
VKREQRSSLPLILSDLGSSALVPYVNVRSLLYHKDSHSKFRISRFLKVYYPVSSLVFIPRGAPSRLILQAQNTRPRGRVLVRDS